MGRPEEIAASVRRQFSPASLASDIAAQDHPSESLTRLKDLAVRFADEERSPLSPEIAEEALTLFDEASKRLHAPLIERFDDDFDTTWAFARFLHRLEKSRDALTWVQHAIDVGEDHPKLNNALARKVDILLDLHDEMPGRGYDEQAVIAGRVAEEHEGSEYTWDLLQRAEEAYFARLQLQPGGIPPLSAVPAQDVA